MNAEISLGATPHPREFAGQLIRQVLSDLATILLDDQPGAHDAFPMFKTLAEEGRPRGVLLPLLARACLAAHHALVDGVDEAFNSDQDTGAEADHILEHLAPGAVKQSAVLRAHESRIAALVSQADPSPRAPHVTLARAIFRLYDGLRSEDEALGRSGLLELHSMVVHFDSVAQAREIDELLDPVRVIRPDRFHDYFMRFVDRARSLDSAGEARAVAALSRDGRIEALIAEDRAHPVRLATEEVRASVSGDDALKDHVILRIRALLVLLGSLRSLPVPGFDGARAETPEYLSLVIAAATAPLSVGGEFARAPLLRVARYNRSLLRRTRQSEGTLH